MLSTTFKRVGGPCNPQHMHADMLKRLFPPDFFDHSFAIVRNPYHRIISEYRMKKSDGKAKGTFDQWLDRALKHYASDPFALDNHLRPQSEFITEACAVYKFEDGLDRALVSALAALDVRQPNLHVPHAKKPFDLVVTPSAKSYDRIAELYAADFKRFGYTMDRQRRAIVPASSEMGPA